jgi:hypothetical protein
MTFPASSGIRMPKSLHRVLSETSQRGKRQPQSISEDLTTIRDFQPESLDVSLETS